MTSQLQGRRVLVTGGATGIGAAAVQVLSEAGGRHRRDISPDTAALTRRGDVGAVRRPRRRGPTLVFLCSEGSRFITGQLIAVDGGLVMLGA